MTDKETNTFSRFPEVGPLNIEDWHKFLEKSTDFFREKWLTPFDHTEKLEDFHQVKLIGNGSFGTVFLIECNKNGELFAMKAIEKEEVIRTKQLGHAKREKLVLQAINFPFTVHLIYFFKDNSYIYMVLPFISGGDLYRHLKRVEKFDEIQARFYLSQIILALEYLHYLDLVYRDLKPENILMDHTGYLKLTDFGFCKHLKNTRTYTLCGTPEYIAPEVILNKGHGKPVDWWALGILVYEMVEGVPPFHANDTMMLYNNVVHQKYKMPSHFSSELKDLVKHILQVDLTKRYGNLKNGVNDIKRHKWFRQTNWMGVLNRTARTDYHPNIENPGDTKHFGEYVLKPLQIAKENKYAEEFDDF